MFVTHDTFFIDNEVRPAGDSLIFSVHAKSLHHFSIGVAKKGVLDLGEIYERLLREGSVSANPYDFGILSGKLAVVLVRTGRLKVLDSGGAKIQCVKINENILAFQATQFEFSALSAGQVKVWRLFAHLDGRDGISGYEYQKSTQHRRQHRVLTFCHINLLVCFSRAALYAVHPKY
jgi:hypothetical protein